FAMSVFWAKRIGATLHADGDESIAVLEKIPHGKSVQVEVRQPRYGPRHRFYWALCQRIGMALGIEPENISDILKISAGHYTSIKTRNYGEVKLPKSIAFHNLAHTGV